MPPTLGFANFQARGRAAKDTDAALRQNPSNFKVFWLQTLFAGQRLHIPRLRSQGTPHESIINPLPHFRW